MARPDFSIIIPTLNEELYLPKLLEDIYAQINKKFEVIVVDGVSDDRTVEVVHNYKKKIPIRIFQSKKRNVSLQRNIGAEKAKGNYLVFLDADSRIGKSFMQQLYIACKKEAYIIMLPKVIPQERSQIDDALFKLANYFIQYSQIIGKPIPPAGVLIIQRDVFRFIGGYDPKGWDEIDGMFPDDHEILLRARRSGIVGKYMDNIQVRFSLRRLKKEGRLSVIRKYLISSIELSMKGKMDKSVNYEMGGHYYSSAYNEDTMSKKLFKISIKMLEFIKKELEL